MNAHRPRILASIAAAVLCTWIATYADAQNRGFEPDAAAAREAGTLLHELGYLRAAPSGAWNGATENAAKKFLEVSRTADQPALKDPALFLLLGGLRDSARRQGRDAVNLFVVRDFATEEATLSISADGQTGLLATKELTAVWDVARRQQIASLPDGAKHVGALSPDGRTAVLNIEYGFTIRMWNVAENRYLGDSEMPNRPGDTSSGSPRVIRFLPSNAGLIVGDNSGGITQHTFDGGKGSYVAEHVTGKDRSNLRAAIVALDVSPDGRLAASLSPFDGALKIWDIGSKRLVRSVSIYAPDKGKGVQYDALDYAAPGMVAFDASGGSLTILQVRGQFNTGGQVPFVHRVDLSTGVVRKLDPRGEITAAAVTASRELLAISIRRPQAVRAQTSDRPIGGFGWPADIVNPEELPEASVDVYDLKSGSLVARVASHDRVWALADDGRTALVDHRTGLHQRNGTFAKADLALRSTEPFSSGGQSPIADVAFAEGTRQAQLGPHHGRMLRLDVDTGQVEELAAVGSAKTPAGRAADDTDGDLDVTMTSMEMRPDGLLVDAAQARIDPPTTHLSPDRRDLRRLVAIDPASGRTIARRVARIDVPAGSHSVRAATWSRDGRMSASVVEEDITVRSPTITRAFVSIVDTGSGREVRRVRLSPLSAEPLSINDSCMPPNCRRSVEGSIPLDSFFGSHAPVAVSGSGRYVFAGYFEPGFAAYEVATGRRVETFDTNVDFQRFMPRARIVPKLTGGEREWDVAVSRRVARGFSAPLLYLTVPGSDDVYVALGGGRLSYFAEKSYLLHFRMGSPRPTRMIEIPARPASAEITSDGGRIALAYDGGLVLVIDAASGNILAQMQGAGTSATRIRFTSDGKRLITRNADGAVRIWDMASGDLLLTTWVFAERNWLSMTPEGFFAGSPQGSERLLVRIGPRSVTGINQVYQALYRPDMVAAKLAGDPDGAVKRAAGLLDLPKLIASGAPPRLTILSPRSGGEVANETISVAVNVADAGGGIGRLEWRANGTTVGVDNDAAGRGGASRDIVLTPGLNVVEVVAYNGKGLVASVPARLEVLWNGTAGVRPPKLFVLAIAVDDYFDGRLRLNFPLADARAFLQTISQSSRGLFADVVVRTVLDKDVSPAGIDAAFGELAATVHQNDVFVLFVAGHGKTVDGKFTFLPRDFRYEDETSFVARGVGQDAWQGWLATVKARRSVVLFDTCESGSLTADKGERGFARLAALDRMTRAMGRTVLSAATDDAPALEGFRGHGVFTYALIEAFGQADLNTDGMIDVLELAQHVDARVPQISQQAFGQRQVPQIRIVGAPFGVGRPIEIAASDTSIVARPPKQPTHILTAEKTIREQPDAGSSAKGVLAAGTMLRVVERRDGFAWVAREGALLGYVDETALLRLQ